jgi:hypothetical protein
MTITAGSGQTSGEPLVLTAIAQASYQILHTAVAGAGPAQRIKITANNLDPIHSHTLFIGLFPTGTPTVPAVVWSIALPINEGALLCTDPNFQATIPELTLNGGTIIGVWADTASMVAASAIVNDQNGIAAVTQGSAQTAGLPLIPTTQIAAVGVLPVLNTGLLVHTAPTGTATPNVISLFAINTDVVGRHATVAIFATGGTVPIIAWQVNVPINSGLYNLTDVLGLTQLVLNGGCFIQVWTTVSGVLSFFVNANTQTGGGSGGGTVAQLLSSGLVAGVISASRYAMFQSGGTGQTTEANAQIMCPGAGTIEKLSAVASATIGAGSSVTCALRVNGVTSTQTVTITNASGTVVQTTTGAPAVVALGSLLDFIVVETAGVAPVANFQVTAELILSS